MQREHSPRESEEEDDLTSEDIKTITEFVSGPAKCSKEMSRRLVEKGYLTELGHQGGVCATSKAHELVHKLEKGTTE